MERRPGRWPLKHSNREVWKGMRRNASQIEGSQESRVPNEGSVSRGNECSVLSVLLSSLKK